MPQSELSHASANRWHRLDNTANLFPVISSKRGPNVYRISVNLSEPVAPELLQQAMEKALPRFSAFKVRLRHGAFWYYLDENSNTPQVQPEDDYPCRTIVAQQNRDFLFRLTFFENRINLEAFHVLADGTGGMQFLMAVVCQYLMLAHPDAFTPEQKETAWFAQQSKNTEDSYAANYTPVKKSTFNLGASYRLKGERIPLDTLSVIHAGLRVDELLARCRELGVSLTQYILAHIGWGIYTQQLKMRTPRQPVRVLLPVNLRNYFESSTTLNFFSNAYIPFNYDNHPQRFEDVLEEVKTQFEQAVNKEQMLEKISYTVGSGYSPFVRAVPLPLKNLVLRLIYERSVKSSTLSFSNVGRVDIPPPFAGYLTGASVLLSPTKREAVKISGLSCGNLFTLSFTSALRNVALQRDIIRHMAADGLHVAVSTNGVDYEAL